MPCGATPGSIPGSPSIKILIMKRLLLTLLVATLPLLSCHRWVLEDRRECPSFLFFDILNPPSDFQSYTQVYTNVYSHPQGAVMDEARTSVRDIRERLFFFSVRRADAVKGYGLIGEEGLVSDGALWRAPLGSNYVPLFRYSYLAEVQEESFIVPVEFTKEYTRVSIQFVGVETFVSAQGRFPFDLRVQGNTCGIDAFTGVPLRGGFEYSPPEEGIGHFEFLLPRQADQDLMLELSGREYISEHAGVQHRFNLYDLLLQKGNLTWTEKNLPDVHLEIDYEEFSVNVSVFPWTQEELKYEF